MVGFMKSALNLFGLNKKDGENVGSGEGATNLEQFLTDLPVKMGFDVSFKKKDVAEPGLHYEVEGSELDSFLGENCEMLDALAHVSMRVLRRHEGVSNAPLEEGQEGIFRVTFDACGFRDKKAQELKDLAIAQRLRVIESGGKPSYVRALGPSERKIIHTTLAELGEVTSESIGRGNFKRIRVRLKDDSQFRRAPVEGENLNEGSQEGVAPRHHAHSDGGGRGRRDGANRGRSGGGGGGFRGQGGGGANRGRGPRPSGRRDGAYQGSRDGGSEINGNVAPNLNLYQGKHVDDNIGNRLAPGEESPYFNSPSGNNDGDK